MRSLQERSTKYSCDHTICLKGEWCIWFYLYLLYICTFFSLMIVVTFDHLKTHTRWRDKTQMNMKQVNLYLSGNMHAMSIAPNQSNKVIMRSFQALKELFWICATTCQMISVI